MLSGRENIYISGTLLGMTPNEIRSKFDEIVAFAELDKFIDMPVRNYSSGMSVRLGFAIAVIATPQILLVDEVLAVGDMAFQKKCFERIHELKSQGTTILLVSHAPGQIWAVCNKAIAINQGITKGVSSVEDACREYELSNIKARAKNIEVSSNEDEVPKNYGGVRGGTGVCKIEKVEVLNYQGIEGSIFEYAEDIILRYHLVANERVSKAIFRVQIDGEIHKAIAIIDNYEQNNELLDLHEGRNYIDIKICAPNLRPGVYALSAAIVNKDIGVHLYFEHNHATFSVSPPSDKFLYADYRAAIHLDAIYRYGQMATLGKFVA
jgi:lipopolysaccharide transport system ATP-binding protein